MLFTALALGLAQPAPCSPLPGWEALAEASRGKFLVFGEMHGTAESPAAVAEYICALPEDEAVLLAIEFGASKSSAFEAAWAGPTGGFRDRLMTGVEDWGVRQDGVASEAMMAMLERIHALMSAGRDIRIAAFNGDVNVTQQRALEALPGQEPHEAQQALNIRAAADAGTQEHVVVLVGNLHARETIIDDTWRPMAMILGPDDDVVTLGQAYDGGASWSCQRVEGAKPDANGRLPMSAVKCGAHKAGRFAMEGMERGFGLFAPGEGIDAYDGYYHVGTITASPPVERAD